MSAKFYSIVLSFFLFGAGIGITGTSYALGRADSSIDDVPLNKASFAGMGASALGLCMTGIGAVVKVEDD